MGPISTRKSFKFLCSLKQKNNSMLTESTQRDKYFEYLGEFDFIFKTQLGHESGDQVGAFDQKNRSKKSHSSVPLSTMALVLVTLLKGLSGEN